MGESLVWKDVPMLSVVAKRVPEASGVYAIVRSSVVAGLRLGIEVLYVGRTVNLRRRFQDHLSPRRQHNLALLTVTRRDGVEFYFAPLKVNELDLTEKYLIEKLNPQHNIRK